MAPYRDAAWLTKRQAVSAMPSVGLANMRENGVRALAVQCHQCQHEVIMNVDNFCD
jgi:hypothetical protein